MFRSVSRTATLTVIALLLVLASVPAAQASPLSGPSLDTPRTGWLDLALSWLDNLLFGAAPEQPGSAFAAAKPSDTEIDDSSTIMSGACIDPAGRPRPCF